MPQGQLPLLGTDPKTAPQCSPMPGPRVRRGAGLKLGARLSEAAWGHAPLPAMSSALVAVGLMV